MGTINIKPINRQKVRFAITGISPLIQHNWSEKARQQMRDKHAGKKTKDREVRDPQQEAEAAMYRTADGQPGVNVLAIKNSIITAAHKDLGIEKTLVRKSLFFPCDDPQKVIPMQCSEPVMREDAVRVGTSTDLRYRPQFDEWRVELTAEIDADLLTTADLATLIDRAGFGVGIGEWRPEKDGEFGRFEVDRSTPMEVL